MKLPPQELQECPGLQVQLALLFADFEFTQFHLAATVRAG